MQKEGKIQTIHRNESNYACYKMAREAVKEIIKEKSKTEFGRKSSSIVNFKDKQITYLYFY